MKIRITPFFLNITLLSPVLGALVAVYGIFIQPGDRGWIESPATTPNFPNTLTDHIIFSLSTAFLLWTVFIFIFNCFYLFLNTRKSFNIYEKKNQRIYKTVVIMSYICFATIILADILIWNVFRFQGEN